MNIYKMTLRYNGPWGGKEKEQIIVAANDKDEAFKVIDAKNETKPTNEINYEEYLKKRDDWVEFIITGTMAKMVAYEKAEFFKEHNRRNEAKEPMSVSLTN